jgi:hypothetical protein
MRSTAGPMNSMNVPAPGRRHLKATVVSDLKVSASPVRSSWTS